MGTSHSIATADRPAIKAACLVQFLCVAVAAVACLASRTSADWPDGYEPRYVQAVEQTSGLVPNGVVRESDSLAHLGDPRMQWSGDQLIMTMLTDYSGYDRNYVDSAYRPEIWVAPVGETVEFFQQNVGRVESLESRYRQYLGMPLSHSDDRIVELLIHPDMLFRPAEDTSIDSPTLSAGRDTTEYEKASLLYPTFDQWWTSQSQTYDSDSDPPYPWTRLGYTYDWGGLPNEIVGATEFIAKRWGSGTMWLQDAAGGWYQAAFSVPDTEFALTVHAVVPTTAYPYYVRSGPDVGNFLVLSDCKTIWAGDRFTPVGSGAPRVDIGVDAIVSSGILIDDSHVDRVFQLTSRGTIFGGLYTPEQTILGHAIEFRSPVRFDNFGLVDAPTIAVRADASSGPAVLANYGTLRAGQYAAVLSGADDTFLNAGNVVGHVLMGAGDDTVLLAGGEIRGTVDGGDHNSGDAFLVQAETPVRVDGDVRGFEQILVARATGSDNASFILNGTLAGDVILGTSGDGYVPGQLAGNFAVDGNVNAEAGAILAPGNSLGAGQVNGDYSQSGGAAFEVEVARTAEDQLVSDTLTVSGTAHLAEGAEIHVRRETSRSELPLRQGDFFAILEAGFLDLAAVPLCESESDVLTFRCASSADQLLLIVDETRAFADLATGERNIAIAGALDADLPMAGGGYASTLAGMQFAGNAMLDATLDSIRPDAYQAFDRAARLVTYSMCEQLAESKQPACGAGSARRQQVASIADDSTGPSLGDLQLSLEPFGLAQLEGSSLTTTGYVAGSAGFLLDANRRLADRILAGVVFGYADLGVDLRGDSGNGRADLYRFGPYAALELEGWRLHGSATFGRHNCDATRTSGPLGDYGADYSTYDGSIYVDVRRPGASAGWTVTPVGSLQYTFSRREAFAESLSGPTALTFTPWDSDSFRGRLGARVDRRISYRRFAFRPAILAGWAHEFLGDERAGVRFSSGVTDFHPPADPFLENAGFVRAAVSICSPDPLEITLAYDGQWGEQTAAHWGSISVTTRF